MRHRLNRRQVIHLGAALASAGVSKAGTAAADRHRDGITFREPARETPIVGEYDVVVCGAGPAGVCAAIEAGRTGARTLLIEAQGCLGGIWTAGLLCWILDGQSKNGLMRDICQALQERKAGFPNRGGNRAFAYEPEAMKLLLEELCSDSGVEVQLHTAVRAAYARQRRLETAVTESKSGRQAWKGKVFVDCTGDGYLAAHAGCGFDFGRADDRTAQPMSLLALISGVERREIEAFVRRADESGGVTKRRLCAEIERGGYSPSYRNPGIYPIYDDLFMLMANHEYGYCGFNAAEVTKATLHARRELFGIVESLRSLGGKWANLRIVATAEQIGIREGRRIHGLYTVTKDDLINGARFDDAVCRVNFGVDVHSVKKGYEGRSYSQGIKSKSYDIPLRSMIARDVDGLMMAGRCISGDFIAHSSYRVTGNAAVMGQAAGRVAALAAKRKVLPQDVRLSAQADLIRENTGNPDEQVTCRNRVAAANSSMRGCSGVRPGDS